MKAEVGPLVDLIGDLDKWIAFAEKARAENVRQAASTHDGAVRTLLIVGLLALVLAAVAEESSASAEQVSASTQQTSATTQEIAASAEALSGTAEQLEQLVERFKLAV